MKFSIAQRLMLLVTGAVITLLVVGLMGYSSSKSVTEDLQYTNDNIITSLNILSRAEAAFLLIRVNALYHLSYDDAAKKAPHDEVIKQKIQEINTLFVNYEKLTSDGKDKTLLEADKSLFADYILALDKVLEKSRANDREGANALIETDWKPAGNKLTAAFQAHAKFNDDLADSIVKTAVSKGHQNNAIVLAFMILGIVVAGSLGLLLRNGITKSLNNMREAMVQAAGQMDFTVRVQQPGHDEIGVTAAAFNNLLEQVQSSIRTISADAEQLTIAAGQMAQTASEVATASLQQSEAASSMASSIEQMSVSINHVGERASDVHRFSSESGNLANNGESVIGLTVEGINQAADSVKSAADSVRQLEKHSENISSVVAVIKEVADQTNLLALNAAIEAARAGEQGRGFAVVADEVRKLAERTATSTLEITNTIASMRTGAQNAVTSMQQVGTQVDKSVERAQNANQVMKQIGNGSRNGVAMVDEIAGAIREQSQASYSVAQQIEKIAQMAEESSGAATESERAARDLDLLATSMHKLVAHYKI